MTHRPTGHIATLLFVLVTSQLPAAETPAPAYSDHSRLLVLRDGEGKEQPITTPEQWAIRRAHILAGMQQAMGELPADIHDAPLDLQVHHTLEQQGMVRQTISLAGDEGDRITAYLYLPAAAQQRGGRLAGMLALHPTGAPGKQIVAGETEKMNRSYALELAQRGYVVIAPDYPSFGELADFDFAATRHPSGTMKSIVNHIRCVDLLASLPQVDPQRIGVIGHSLGGHNALFVAAFDERIAAAVTSCGWCPFHDYKQGNLAAWAQDRYMPRVRDVYGNDPDRMPFDFYEVLAAIAPRAVFSSSPLHDSNFKVAGVRKAIPVALDVYALWGAEEQLQVRYPDCEHDFPPGVREQAYAFLDSALAAATPADVEPLAERQLVQIPSTYDGTQQPSYVMVPRDYDPEGEPAPLLVSLHSWSADLEQRHPRLEKEALRRGWIYLFPNFRGRNDDPAACGSLAAQQDILDAVHWAQQQYHIDASRIYLTGSSGGGHMTMLMAGRHPQVWAAASAWVGISDLAAWHERHAADNYGQMLRDACGGEPGSSAQVDHEYQQRSPLTHLAGAAGLPLDLAAGVQDGYTGSVPIRHTLNAFNRVAEASGGQPISQQEIEQIGRPQGRLEQPRPSDLHGDPTYGRAIYLRRQAGNCRATIFEGGHERLDRAAIQWLERQRKAEPD